jgi:hypothetical protein
LASGLTRNQGAPLENADEIGTSPRSAAPAAANGAADDASIDASAQRAALIAGDDAELGEVLDCWATLPAAIQQAILTLVRSCK